MTALKLESGKWYCVEYNFDDECTRNVFGPAKRLRDGTYQFPQCGGARWGASGVQLNGFFPSIVIQEAKKDEIKSGSWFGLREGRNKPIYNRSSP